jgi:hypothetical protein
MVPLLDVAKRVLEQRGDEAVMQGIETLPADAIGLHDRVLSKYPQLMGDRRLLESEHVDEIADWARAAEQAAEDLDTNRRREREHDVGHLLGQPLIDPRGLRVTHRRSLGSWHSTMVARLSI